MKKTILFTGVLLVLAAIAAVACFSLRHGDKNEYTTVKVERGNIKVTVATTGTVKPQNRVIIKPTVAGRIEEIYVEEGNAVEKGHTLALLSSTERALLLDVARAKSKSELEYWEQAYKPMPVVAPISGDIIVRNVEAGQMVTASDTLFVMADRLIIQANIDETDIGRVKVGQAAELTLDAYPNEVITGRVDTIAYEAQTINNVTMYTVDILPDYVPPFMRSGMTANIQIITETANNVLTLPASSVFGEGAKTFVRQNESPHGRKTINTPVKTGLSDGKNVEIVSGLKEGDQALISRVLLPESKNSGVNPFSPFRRKK